LSEKVAEIRQILSPDTLANEVVNLFQSGITQKQRKIEELKELRNYLFATDTTTTSNKVLPWKNSTTVPKMTQIRDILHTNYMNALFPNDRWLRWEGYSKDAETKEKREKILAYMDNKLREGNFIEIVSELVYDYIDTGNVFADCEYVTDTNQIEGESIADFIGPKAKRISFYDHIFDPTARSYKDSWKITRYIKSIGQLMVELDSRPELSDVNKEILKEMVDIRQQISSYTPAEVDKAAGYQVDGFGSLAEYYASGYVEIIEFEGSIHDMVNNTVKRNRSIWVVDRNKIIYDQPLKTWTGKSTKVHSGWRKRPDNIYAMGPLDNLVGMQYRLDHLENLKADAMDLAVLPPLAIRGDVEEFTWAPGSKIHLGDEGEITELGKNLNGVITAQNEEAILEQKMEDFAGAPKEAAGIRSPGEKTMFEVQTLENARGRIFQQKVNQFEREILEPLLNNMLETARRNIGENATDLIRVMDDDNGVTKFLEITKEDIVAKGKLRPIGSRHFAANAQLIQNLNMVVNNGIWEFIKQHASPKRMAAMVENVMGFDRFELFSDNAFIYEQAETKKTIDAAQDEVMRNQLTEQPDIEENI